MAFQGYFVLPLYYINLKNVVTNVSDFTGSDYSVCYRLLIVT